MKEIEATIYQSKAERYRDEEKVQEYRQRFKTLQAGGYIAEVELKNIPGTIRDDDENEMHAKPILTRKANQFQQWATRYPQDVELLFLDRGPEFYEHTQETHYRIKFDTPFVELTENDELRGVFPSRIGDTVVDVSTLCDVLQNENSWDETELDILDYKSSGSRKHDAWRDQFISRSDELLGEEWDLTGPLEFDVDAPEFEGVAGAIDVIFSRNPSEYYIVDIKPEANRDEFDKGIGQLYRYAELFSRQERLQTTGEPELNLAIASPSIPSGLQKWLKELG